ncbi:putative LOC100569746 [Trichonephila clavipes]|nr:putative LOC100569746 [Trichonephila clavipes]
MNEDRTTKNVFNAQPIDTRRKGRPNLRWIDGLEIDLLVLRTRNWITLAGRRLAWKRLLEKAEELWFQQDGSTCHTARATIDLLKDTFGDRLISRFVPVNWPPRSCDLTPLDYFLWGYVKSLIYADKPQTLDHLEDNIRRVITDIRPQMLEKVIENWTSRLDYIRASRGSPMPEIIFKITVTVSSDNGQQWSSDNCMGGTHF